jgi:hypothetical protein
MIGFINVNTSNFYLKEYRIAFSSVIEENDNALCISFNLKRSPRVLDDYNRPHGNFSSRVTAILNLESEPDNKTAETALYLACSPK